MLEFLGGIVIGLIFGSIFLMFLAILISWIMSEVNARILEKKRKEYNRYVERKHREFLNLKKEYLKYKNKLSKLISKTEGAENV